MVELQRHTLSLTKRGEPWFERGAVSDGPGPTTSVVVLLGRSSRVLGIDGARQSGLPIFLAANGWRIRLWIPDLWRRGNGTDAWVLHVHVVAWGCVEKKDDYLIEGLSMQSAGSDSELSRWHTHQIVRTPA